MTPARMSEAFRNDDIYGAVVVPADFDRTLNLLVAPATGSTPSRPAVTIVSNAGDGNLAASLVNSAVAPVLAGNAAWPIASRRPPTPTARSRCRLGCPRAGMPAGGGKQEGDENAGEGSGGGFGANATGVERSSSRKARFDGPSYRISASTSAAG
jgi:hypothetical protein